MKRVKPQSGAGGVFLPSEDVAGGLRLFGARTLLDFQGGSTSPSGCLACPDAPCVNFSADEVAKPARAESPHSPDTAVCPTGAISCGVEGIAAISDEACIACGLCVARCPVGAISVDLHSGSARVERPDPNVYVRAEVPLAEFGNLRNALSAVTRDEAHPFPNASQVSRQVALAAPALDGQSGQRVLRLLSRNAFLLDGAAARLKNPGDNNAWCELAVDDGDRLLIAEVEPSGDVLDAMRRALAGCAIVISRYEIERENLAAGLVLHRLPNERVDYYRVVQDVRSRFGIDTFTIPLALLLLAIRSNGIGLAQDLDDLCTFDDDRSLERIQALFGHIDDPVRAGLAPPK